MGITRRKHNQLAEAEAKAMSDIASEAKQQGQSRQQQQPKQQPNPFVQYLWTLALACVFWVVVQALFKYSAHLA
jgi:hypothetical protein